VYLGSDVTHALDKYLSNRLNKYDRIWETNGRIFKTKAKKEIRLKSYGVVERHILLHGNESWAAEAGNINKIQPVKMRCLIVKRLRTKNKCFEKTKITTKQIK
jgi:hypothetical protein